MLRSCGSESPPINSQRAQSDTLPHSNGHLRAKNSVYRMPRLSPAYISHQLLVDGSIFSVLLEASLQYAFVNISYADDTTGQQCFGQIPCIVAKCGAYLKDQGTLVCNAINPAAQSFTYNGFFLGLYVEGIFRLSGSARRIGELQHIFDIPPLYGSQLDWQGYSIHDAANVLRRFLNSLPDPVINHKSYNDFRNVLGNVFIFKFRV